MDSTTAQKVTRLELYHEAVNWIEQAVDLLGQAHASLRDIGYDDETPTPTEYRFEGGSRFFLQTSKCLNIEQLVERTYALLVELKTRSECGDCGHKISAHLPVSGCDYERGDALRGDVLVAQGPCGCKAWKETV